MVERVRFFGGAVVPYSAEELTRFLGKEPEKFCSRQTAIEMSVKSWERLPKDDKLLQIGLGCTASLFKEDQRKERENHAFVATHNGKFTKVWHLNYKKYDHRIEQEIMLSIDLRKILVDSSGFFLSDLAKPEIWE